MCNGFSSLVKSDQLFLNPFPSLRGAVMRGGDFDKTFKLPILSERLNPKLLNLNLWQILKI